MNPKRPGYDRGGERVFIDPAPESGGQLLASAPDTEARIDAAAHAVGRPSWMLYTERQRWGYLAVLFFVSTSNYYDRNVISVLLEPIKREFHVSDTLLGLLGGFCFAAFYAVFGIPIARWADRGNRRIIIALSLGIWSVMTALCGLAQNFVQLALARIGVGAGEGGSFPPAQSLIVDYFPPGRRASAIAIYTAAATAGYLLGFSGGGYLAATHGWRVAFLAGGVPGIVLALIANFGLGEPRMQQGFPEHGEVERLHENIARLAANRSFVRALIGCILYWFCAYGALLFVPSFLVRVQHVTLARVSIDFGAVGAVSSVIGTVGGGWLADRLSVRDVRWLAWLPAMGCALAAPLYIVAFALHRFESFLVLAFFAGLLLTGGMPPVFAAIHAICGSRRRAMAIAIVMFVSTLIGGGFGPLVTGVLSDALGAVYGANGLRFALMLACSLLAVAASLFYLFGRAMPADIEG